MSKIFWQAERTGEEYNAKDDESFFEDPYKSLVKESSQNSLDAIDEDLKKVQKSTLFKYGLKKVNLEYQIIELSGKAKDEWLEAIDYKGSFNNLVTALEETLKNTTLTGTEEIANQERLSEITKAKKMISSKDPVYMLNIIDTNTVGLDGKDYKEDSGANRRFSSLFFSTKASLKGTGAGSWGLGKNSFSKVSHLGMFITCSNPVDKESCGKTKNDNFRIYGMSLQSQANLMTSEDQYVSSSWKFGEKKTIDEVENPKRYEADEDEKFPSTNWSKSSWNNTEIAEKLLLDGIKKKNGTVLQIPILKVDNLKGDNKLKSLSDELEKQASMWLWPCILSKKIEIKISTVSISEGSLNDNKTKMITKIVDPLNEVIVQPYCHIYTELADKKEKNFETKFNDDSKFFNVEGVKYFIPPKNNGEEKKNNITPHEPLLLLKRVDINELRNEKLVNYRNTTALIRGAGIVVDYLKSPLTKETVSYTGILFAGTSYKNNSENKLAEEFLRLAENASHNMWWPVKSLNKLKFYFGQDDHSWGSGRLGNRLRKPIHDNIKKFFSDAKSDSGRRNKWMESFFVIKKPPKPKKKFNIEGERIKSNKYRITVSIEKKQKVIIEVLPSHVLSILDNEKAGKIKVKAIQVNGSDFKKDINTRDLEVKRSEDKISIKSKENNASFNFDVILEERTVSNIAYGNAGISFEHKILKNNSFLESA